MLSRRWDCAHPEPGWCRRSLPRGTRSCTRRGVLINPELTAWARRHHGLVTLDAWRAAGHSRSSFYRALDAELLTGLLPGVAALAGRPIGPVERIAAGVLAFGPGVVASHRSAAYLWDAPVTGDRPVDLTSTGRRGGTTIDGYLVHRPRDLDALRTPLRRQIPTTAPARVLFDLGVVVDRRVVLRTFESFLVAGHVTVRAVEAELARGRRPGRTGTTALAWALTQGPRRAGRARQRPRVADGPGVPPGGSGAVGLPRRRRGP